MRSDPDTSALLAALRRHLRRSGLTAKAIAGELGVGEATAKRWLAGRGLTLDRLGRLAALAGLGFGDLVREAEAPAAELAQELTLAQECALSADVVLALVFIVVLGGELPSDIPADFPLAEAQVGDALARLERLALIDRRAGGRIVPLVDRAIVWRKPPMRALFEAWMKPQYAALDFSAPNTVYASELVKLSERGAAELAELIERHRREVQDLATRDRESALLARRWYTVLGVMRAVDMGGLREDGP